MTPRVLVDPTDMHNIAESILEMDAFVAVIVTFHPDIMVLTRQATALGELAAVVIVDNGSTVAEVDGLRALASGTTGRIFLVEAGRNLGLAGGLNLGVAEAKRYVPNSSAVLLLDQDSEFFDDVPGKLLARLNQVQAENGTACCVGPSMDDISTGMSHGFHHIVGGWRWARAYPTSMGDLPMSVANLNGSGTTMPLALYELLGGMDADLFIDHVDTEWSFRVLAAGGLLFGDPTVSFTHRMGEAGRRIWLLGWRVWPERSPLRHQFLYRNTLRLLRRPYVPRVWKCWALAKMIVTFFITLAIDSRRGAQVRAMRTGVVEGWRR
ncbi:glycosyltransferase [Pinirhizobacter sp.]|jgi:rhamnosyltransferase|uniref:glycosyltransferase n=1 Tax=Pinirhizobacter sp. TaxID=2950432 RepID=UPI002F410C77